MRWDDRVWTPWLSLSSLTNSRRLVAFDWLSPDWSHGPGVYRVRRRKDRNLVYIGESNSVLPRLRQHVRAADRCRGRSRATVLRRTSGFARRLATNFDRRTRIEVSWTSFPGAEKADLRELEGHLLDQHMRVTGHEPKWQGLPGSQA